ncbi:hypothetical protein BCR43DRAFT_431069 [Syncephalastrum racemosum]|uniref:Uncharacterized protein n=1 Tax=Syncephalastrum racemosum TaxID=13706 RepID=A0A1X2HWK4_SYNRA|nr:hypothetical protein BCR43DRAFT_431069 [Syncephalastrum racemosum]
MTSFIHEDGEDVVMMERDSHIFPVDDAFDYHQYMDLKPPDRMVAAKAEPREQQQEDSIARKRGSY